MQTFTINKTCDVFFSLIFLEVILYSNINGIFIFKAFGSKSQFIKNNLVLERKLPYC